jgi:hypothetical protein
MPQLVLRIFRRNRMPDMLRFRGREQDKLQHLLFMRNNKNQENKETAEAVSF